MTGSAPHVIAGRLRRGRDRGFTGRTAELAVFRAALAGDEGAPAVLFVHGPGGIGKSMLLRRFAAEARATGRPVLEIDGRTVQPTPEAFEREAGAALTEDGTVLVIDTFERCQGLEGWLRDRFLPRLPDGAVAVIAGRQPPDTEWTSDPGWADLLYRMALRNLSPDEAGALLSARGVPRQSQAELLAFTGGHPLALALAAAVAVREPARTATRWKPSMDVVATLLSRLVGEVPSPLHRRALEVCARAHVTTETLLRVVLGDDAAALFAWLRTLPFIESAQDGLFPHDVVRQALEEDLRWRDPDGYAELHGRLGRHLFEQIRTSPADGTLSAVRSFLFLYRDDRYMSDFNSWREAGEVRLTPYEAEDRRRVEALAAEVEGEESAALAVAWLERRPDAFRMCRTARENKAVGFSAWLRLDEAPHAFHDPVAEAAWNHARATRPLRDGEHVAVARFSVTAPEYPKISPVENLHQWRTLAEAAKSEGRVAWMYVAVRTGTFWTPYMTSLGLRPVAERPRVGALTYTLFAIDWRVQPVRAWAEEKTRLMLSHVRDGSRTVGTGGEEVRPDAEFTVLSRPEFDAALRDALRAFFRPQEWSANPLTRSRLTAGTGRPLPQILADAVEGLRSEAGGEKYYRAVSRTYLAKGMPTQQVVAQRLGLPFSTYRRHLTGGITRLCDALWRQEIYGQPATTVLPQPTARDLVAQDH
ncbi:ATP-binding protein [Streptomyces sp. ISL-12]|uniref:ATP-binding protein n=1 Tax=Streptomyces sp. ISL-12 TaxID=2819177 RepID=UPI001BEB725A|nr:ATP-binding protein [Streptomyces sp. ISL-12]MBT2409446.1 ATP-binding protein [Streptomyces sp. ISL-12]